MRSQVNTVVGVIDILVEAYFAEVSQSADGDFSAVWEQCQIKIDAIVAILSEWVDVEISEISC